jgi:predicted glycosyltransferase
MTRQKLEHAVHRLEQYGRVLISAETSLPDSLTSYANPVAVEDVHHLLAYATLYLGEGASMAAESAVLGTAGIKCNPLDYGYLQALEKEFGLVYNTYSIDAALKIAEDLLSRPDLKQQWQAKQQKLLSQSDDLCEFMIETIKQAAHS